MKEYDSQHLVKFEGEFLNGKRNGIGKGYDTLYHTTYEGNYSNGKESGKGKLYNKKREIIRRGIFIW